MAAAGRLYAPVAAPPPPKPPQLNICASALMPDVATDTFAPGGAPQLAALGLRHGTRQPDQFAEGWRGSWDRPPGATGLHEHLAFRNSLIAAIDTMSAVQMEQATEAAGVTPTSLPTSLYGATADSRWTGGFQYAPENQSQGILADPCGQTIDLPAITPPTLSGANTGTGTLTSGTYRYKVTALNANGESLPSSEASVAVTGGAATLTITLYGAGNVTTLNVYRTAINGATNTEHLLSSGTGVAVTATETTTRTITFVDTGSGTVGATAPPSTDTTAGPGNYTNLPIVQYTPFLIQVEDECSTWGFSERDYVGRALRLLDNATPNAIERELWLGAFAQNTLTGPLAGTNAFFTQSSTSANGGTGIGAIDLTPGSSGGGGTPPSITRGTQILEDYLANTGFGGQGMIHVAPETAPNLLGSRRVGGLLLSVMDNIIVPGSGYPTSGALQGPIGNTSASPGAGFAWMFATDLISVRLDKPNVWPETMAEATDRGTAGQPNTIRFRAQRFAAATWDVNRLAACRVALTT